MRKKQKEYMKVEGMVKEYKKSWMEGNGDGFGQSKGY